jgi:uncharacterized protein YaaN involved in tellurite resistance
MEIPDIKAIEQELEKDDKVLPDEAAKLKQQAENNALALLQCDIDAVSEKSKFVAQVEDFGLDTIQKSGAKNALLKVSVDGLSKSGAEGGEVSKSLTDLQKQIKDLDPSIIDFTKKGLLGKITNPVRQYFSKYEKAESVIENIMKSLDKGKTILKNDNTTLAIEQASLRELSKKLSHEIEMGTLMDNYIEEKLYEAQAENMDADKVSFIQEEVLFPLRQRITDMQQMIIVNQQGVIAMEVIQRNNKELMRGVDRAKNVTVSALRTAVMAASALYNQKIVLEKIQALNETTSNIIGATSQMLREQGTQIHRQSVESTISIDDLTAAFENAVAALDEISNFKKQALPVMKQNIEQFKELADKGEAEIKKLEAGKNSVALQ